MKGVFVMGANISGVYGKSVEHYCCKKQQDLSKVTQQVI